ncbi:hypothetical protein G6F57_017466 [Rhizopus arrhizus]|nr:hypothetical protein G6F57_017466 [Rhizopus arrhizus]
MLVHFVVAEVDGIDVHRDLHRAGARFAVQHHHALRFVELAAPRGQAAQGIGFKAGIGMRRGQIVGDRRSGGRQGQHQRACAQQQGRNRLHQGSS